ncbi:hypothetical protein LWI28_011585 [Acer negundo]|uniref:Uncharacterized protein n=1 Tax=Acer negundo TaxID=4023 RepID=A0AAD5IQQ3_ACENE|nr:hypothetical protein LWI28_011585 [Acer negundo]
MERKTRSQRRLVVHTSDRDSEIKGFLSPHLGKQNLHADEISKKVGGVKDDLPNPTVECEEAERACKQKKADDTHEATEEAEGAQKEDSPSRTLQIPSSDEDLY